jgi:hypothetical protein
VWIVLKRTGPTILIFSYTNLFSVKNIVAKEPVKYSYRPYLFVMSNSAVSTSFTGLSFSFVADSNNASYSSSVIYSPRLFS